MKGAYLGPEFTDTQIEKERTACGGKYHKLSEKDLQRQQNRIEHNLEFAEVTAFHKAVSLGYYELLGDANWINAEGAHYRSISVEAIQNRAIQLFQPHLASVIYYHPKISTLA